MQRILVIVLVATCVCAGLQTLAHHEAPREAFVSDASHVIGTYVPESSDHSPEAMAAAANAFLETLDADQRLVVSHDLNSPERRRWTNLPQRENNGGLPLGDCDDVQVKAFCDMLACMLSEQGYTKICNLMLADDQLLRDGRPRPGFGTETYYLVIFGTPSATEPWGLQLDGHHLGLNLSIEGENMTLAPSHIGMQPDTFQIAETKYRPMADENDIAFRLVNSLNNEQKAEAVVSDRRGSIVTGPGNDSVPKLPGISCSSFDDLQNAMITKLIAKWVNDLPPKQAEKRMNQLVAELEETRFGWSGSLSDGSAISYTIQGPSLIIEYGSQTDDASHIHTMYRDPTNAYGKQLDTR